MFFFFRGKRKLIHPGHSQLFPVQVSPIRGRQVPDLFESFTVDLLHTRRGSIIHVIMIITAHHHHHIRYAISTSCSWWLEWRLLFLTAEQQRSINTYEQCHGNCRLKIRSEHQRFLIFIFCWSFWLFPSVCARIILVVCLYNVDFQRRLISSSNIQSL